jgi:3',5'-nucleoside bisphosphate phosphatase
VPDVHDHPGPRCDLHVHSTASDGTDDPAALPGLVQRAGLAGFALTDHDTLAGLPAARAAADALGLRFLPGVEVSADPDVFDTGRAEGNLHLLAYGIDPAAPALNAVLADLRAARDERNPQIVAGLNALGVRVTLEEVERAADGGVIGKPHIAQVLVDKGYVRTIHEAFRRYIGSRGAVFIERRRADAETVLDAIREAGGTAVLAHPVQLKLADDDLEHLIAALREMGLAGLETRHPDHDAADVERYERLADRFHLVPTAGSDYHGARKSHPLGVPSAGLEVIDALLQSK